MIVVTALVTAVEFRSKVVSATLEQSCCSTSNVKVMVDLKETKIRPNRLGSGTIIPDGCLGS